MILVHVEWCMHADREKMESEASRSGGAVKYPHQACVRILFGRRQHFIGSRPLHIFIVA